MPRGFVFIDDGKGGGDVRGRGKGRSMGVVLPGTFGTADVRFCWCWTCLGRGGGKGGRGVGLEGVGEILPGTAGSADVLRFCWCSNCWGGGGGEGKGSGITWYCWFS